MRVSESPVVYVPIVFTTVGTAAVATITLPYGMYQLVYHGFERTAGSAATYQPLLTQTAGHDASDEDTRLATTPAVAVATVTRTQVDGMMPFYVAPSVNNDPSSTGTLSYYPQFDAGADNSAVVTLVFRRLAGGTTATVTVT